MKRTLQTLAALALTLSLSAQEHRVSRIQFVCVPGTAVSLAGRAVLFCDSDTNTLSLSINGGAFFDPTVGGGGVSLPVADTTSIVSGSVDVSKLLRFEVDGFTTATTRVLTPQNADYTIAGTDIQNTFTSTQEFDEIWVTGITWLPAAPGANQVYASPNLVSGNPGFRSLTEFDLPLVSITKGGTGNTTSTAAFDALGPGTTKGDLIVFDGANHVRLPVGATGLSLKTNPATATGLEWSSAAGGVDSVFTRTGAVVAQSGDYTAAQVTNAAAVNVENTFTSSQTINVSGTAASRLTIQNTDREWRIYTVSGLLDFRDQTSAASILTLDNTNTAASPLWRIRGDTNTGLFWPGADTIGFTTAGVERLRVQSDGPLEFIEFAGDPTCSAGEFTIYGNSTTNTLRKCQNGTVSDVGGGGGTAAIGAKATSTVATSIPNNAFTAVPFATEAWDDSTFHDNATNNTRVTVPTGEGGRYLLIGNAGFLANTTGRRAFRFLVNGTTIYAQDLRSAGATAGVNNGATISDMLALSAGDYVELQVYQDSGSALVLYCDNVPCSLAIQKQ